MTPSITLNDLQEQLKPWTAHNFGDRPKHHPLLGIVEEVGELSHAHLKDEQGIRGTKEKHHAKKVDALADILIFMADYANQECISLQDALDETWPKVRSRDWKKNKDTGQINA